MSGFEKRTVYIHPMTYTGARAFAAVLEGIGLPARVFPPSDERTLELGGLYSSGEECYPLKITLGDILKLFVDEGASPDEVAILMPSSNGPCRFGQYHHYMKHVLDSLGYEGVAFISPSCEDGYGSFSHYVREIQKPGWVAIVAADILRKLLLMTRPYEREEGSADALYEECLDGLCRVLREKSRSRTLMSSVKGELKKIKEKFAALETVSEEKPLIGIVGEIFCRLNRFSNDELIRKIESLGGECWQSDVAEWILYTDREHQRVLRRMGRLISTDMFLSWFKYSTQKRLEEELYSVFSDVFRGREEPEDVTHVLRLASPYLPQGGALGEMILSVGKAVYYHEKGASGVVDISPFTCMNGIVSEAIYQDLSARLGGFPIRVFYFDESHRDVEYELEIFMDLARNYRERTGRAEGKR
ncbi:MAG: hypothetical protein D6713_00785 [Deltaproteobacteria bacterium]|nr:MAG: hypothetical protein D6713_00785 [Deltaproteobacteria bacterium]